jgi:hypothetical protein
MYRSLTITAADLAEADSEYVAFLLDDAPTLPEGELARVLANPELAAELAEVRRPAPLPTTDFATGEARRRRDKRIADREARVTRLLAEVAELLAAQVEGAAAQGRAA